MGSKESWPTEDLLETILLDWYFDGQASNNLRASVRRLMQCAAVTRHLAPSPRVHQALVIRLADPDYAVADQGHSRQKASVRLHLVTGELLAFELKGDVAAALARLDALVAWAAPCHGALEVDAAKDVRLADIMPASPDKASCHIRLVSAATLLPRAPMDPRALARVVHAVLNRLRAAQGKPERQDMPEALNGHFTQELSIQHPALQAYVAGLNQDAIALIRDVKSEHHLYDDVRVYGYLAAATPELARNRIQAMRELPWLLRPLAGIEDIHVFSLSENPPSCRADSQALKAIRTAIDAGQPLFRAVANSFKVPIEVVRWSRRTMLPNPHFPVRRLELLLLLLSWMPREKRPASIVSWGRSATVVRTLLSALLFCGPREEMSQILLDNPRCGRAIRHWLRDLLHPSFFEASGTVERLQSQYGSVCDANDYLLALTSSVQMYCRDAGHTNAVNFVLDWLASRSLRQLLSLASQWHAALHRRGNALQDALSLPRKVSRGWPAVLVQPFFVGGMQIIELTTEQDLFEEGRILHHCVGTYDSRCAAGDSMIVSIRDANGQRLTTAELTLDTGLPQVRIAQHKAAGNALPPEQCQAALRSLVDLLNGESQRKRLGARIHFQKRQRQRLKLPAHYYSLAENRYQDMALQEAWTCTFGPAPRKNSMDLKDLYEWAHCRSMPVEQSARPSSVTTKFSGPQNFPRGS